MPPPPSPLSWIACRAYRVFDGAQVPQRRHVEQQVQQRRVPQRRRHDAPVLPPSHDRCSRGGAYAEHVSRRKGAPGAARRRSCSVPSYECATTAESSDGGAMKLAQHSPTTKAVAASLDCHAAATPAIYAPIVTTLMRGREKLGV